MADDPQQIPSPRYLKTDNIQAGDVILEEEPWIWSLVCLNGHFEKEFKPDQMVCHYCLLSPGKLQACSACKSAWYCGSACQRADWVLRHKHGDCRMQQVISRMNISWRPPMILYPFELLSVVRRLMVRSASTRLFSAKQCDANGNPDSPLWHALIDSPSNTDTWVDIDRKMYLAYRHSPIYNDLVRKITWKDLPNNLIEKRISTSLVVMCDYGSWKNILQSMQFPTKLPSLPKHLALGACLEMSKFPHNCNPNAVVINEGRLVRMVALENIPNLAAVRLTHMHKWIRDRYGRRMHSIFGVFGFDCYCTRCCAGDSGETTLFGLRCPNWVTHYNNADGTSSGCDGIVTGLRRTDIDRRNTFEYLSERHGAEIAAVVDEPRALLLLSAEEANKPAHERAECQKCHARYDKQTMDKHILKHLTLMGDFTPTYCERVGREKCVTMLSGSEKYFHPANVYTTFEQIVLAQCLEPLLTGKQQLDANSLAWMRRCAQRMLTRIESEGLTQIDLCDLFMTAGYYSLSVTQFQRESRRLEQQQQQSGGGGNGQAAGTDGTTGMVELYRQTAEWMNRVGTAAFKKLQPLLVH